MRDRTVLVVDDEPDIRDTLRDVLEDEGYRVVVASNGREALALLTGGPAPSVVVLDLLMPIMNGNDLYEAMRADPNLSEIPIIVSTSDPSRAPTGALLMNKPFDLDRMLAVIESLC